MSESTLQEGATKRKAEQRRELRKLGGATLKFAQQWATECNLPTVRRGTAILARRAEAEKAMEFSAAKTAAAEDDLWVGANPPLDVLFDLLAK